VSAEARRFLDEALPLATIDTGPAALAELRREIHAQVAPAGKALAARLGVQVTEGELAGVPVQWVKRGDPGNGHTILYFFGGGHITGSPDEDSTRGIAAFLSHHLT
jgi:acetyl esterase/lipase